MRLKILRSISQNISITELQLGEQQFETIQAQTSETSVLQLHFRCTYIFLLGMPLLQHCYPTQYEDSCHLPSVIGSLIG